jgi:hypothetical protein
MKFEVTLELLEEMAECIHNVNWADGEIYAYMKSCVTDDESYDPEDWENKEDEVDIDFLKSIDAI